MAPGWNPTDFLLAPGRYDDRYRDLYEGVARLRELWRGQPVAVKSADGAAKQIRIYPTPVQRELPLWITAARSGSFRQAGALGTNVLTHLLDQDIDALAEKIAIYRAAREEHGHDPDAGRVTVMCHTFLAGDIETVRRLARKPFCDYLKASKPLLRGLAQSRGQNVDIDALSDADMQSFVEFLYERFEGTRALLGTPEGCLDMTLRLRAAGADEIACLLDFGPAAAEILEHLSQLEALRDLHASACGRQQPVLEPDARHSHAALAPQAPVALSAAAPDRPRYGAGSLSHQRFPLPNSTARSRRGCFAQRQVCAPCGNSQSATARRSLCWASRAAMVRMRSEPPSSTAACGALALAAPAASDQGSRGLHFSCPRARRRSAIAPARRRVARE